MTATAQPHAFLFKDDQMIDLNTLRRRQSGWVLQAAYAINDNGVIVGEGLLNGTPRGFRLTLSSEDEADVTAPFVAAVTATPDSLWPPKHQLVDVSVNVTASDDSNEPPSCQIAGITSSDPDSGTGDGDTSGDAVITGAFSAKLRAERSGGRERVYSDHRAVHGRRGERRDGRRQRQSGQVDRAAVSARLPGWRVRQRRQPGPAWVAGA